MLGLEITQAFLARGLVLKYGVITTVVLAAGFVHLIKVPVTVDAHSTVQSAPAAPTQASIDSGKAAYGTSCAFCHGADAAGGPVGPTLVGSPVVRQDKNGELILPIVHGARASKGMPKINIPDEKVTDIAAWLHTMTGSVPAPAAAPQAKVGMKDQTAAPGTPAPTASRAAVQGAAQSAAAAGEVQTGGVPAGAQAQRIRGGALDAPPQQRLIAYPDRPKAPQDVLDRGKGIYGVSCAFCHGSDAAGGEVGPSLIRSSVVLEDQNGELIMPIVHGARIEKGMPRIDISDAQTQDIAAWLHSLKVASRTDPNENNINIVRGDAAAGKVYFQKTCASCHSVDGDLKSFATRFPQPKVLQQTWMLPGGGGGRGPGGANQMPGLHVPPTSVTVTMADGRKVDGKLTRIDDFYVGLTQPDGTVMGFDRMGDTPKVELHDALAPHRALLATYKDKDIHDLTAYLVTLK